ncbi:MAG TPA: aminoacetone oxidase family FAD-binding enzyme [Holophagaceae bacterium]|nr:aminoacetone oxidase family FAD-binding enzyme [Holophagaceae bacterium]
MRVLVVGGGAAGMVAAWRAALGGHRVTLLEANNRLGVKLRISGGGKCNVTHAGPLKEVLGAFAKEQARFLRPAMHRFTNDEVVELLRREGVETYTRDNGRVFPMDRPGSAAAVVAAFESVMARAGAEVRVGARVTGIEGAAPRVTALRLGEERLEADLFIFATGGASYSETGTRGEVLGWLRGLGLPMRSWFPALAPIPLAKPRPAWEGVAWRDGELLLMAGKGGRRLARFKGDLVFTKTGISGPAALELSQAAEDARLAGAAFLAYAHDARSFDEVDAEAITTARTQPHLSVLRWVQQWIPERCAETLLKEASLSEGQRLKDLPKDARRDLVEAITGSPLGAPGPVPLSRGEVAAGGLKLEAVDPHTMAVRGFENLRVCGELLDVDGPVGGYNLQAAFSTGFVAGEIQG